MANAEAPLHPGKTPTITVKNGLRIREDVLYTDASGDASFVIRQRADRALELLGGTLKRILKADETILYMFGAHTRRGLMQLILRRFSFLADTLLVITDKRIIALRLWSGTLGMKWTGSIRAARWPDVAKASISNLLLPTLDLQYHNGTHEAYWKIQRYDAKKLQTLLGSPLLGTLGEPSATKCGAALCPRCLQSLVPRKYKCWHCQLVFKDEKNLWLRALLLPGGAYWYTGIWISGVLIGAYEAFVLGTTLLVSLGKSGVAWAQAFGTTDPDVTPSQAPFIVLFTLFGMYLLLLSPFKILSILRCRPYVRDFLPVQDPKEIR